jgi:hypothetical protein
MSTSATLLALPTLAAAQFTNIATDEPPNRPMCCVFGGPLWGPPDAKLSAAGGHAQRPADFGHLGHLQPADSLHQKSLRHRSEVVKAERTGLRHPVVDVEVHFGRHVADRPGSGNSDDNMKVLYGCLPG